MFVPSNVALAQTSSTSGGAHSGTSGIGWQGWGVRAGLSSNPDQAFGGVHFNLGYFAKDVRFRPTIEMGFGDGVTTLQALAEVHYIFSKVQVWKPYVGGGLGLAYVNVHDNDPGSDESDTEVAFAAMGGVETKLKSGNTFGIEGKFGLGDNDPDFKASVNWSF
jgi:opacity protein-like surface antigen